MNEKQYSRSIRVMGKSALELLRTKRVAVFGIGGVGGGVVEALARSGVGTLDLIDNDVFDLSNLNRQLYATYATLGQYKVDAAKERIHLIDPDIQVNTYRCFYLPETKDAFDFSQWDYVVDAVDTVTAKLSIIEEAMKCNVPVISCMGCGNRVDPSKLAVMDLYQTAYDPLAKVMRYECRRRGIRKLKAVCSTEKPIRPLPGEVQEQKNRHAPGSTAFVPPAAGFLAASAVVLDLTHFDPEHR